MGLIRIPGQLFVLTRFERLSLRSLGPQVPIGEFHYAWDFSPDCSKLALGISAPGQTSGRLGIRIVDLQRMAIGQDVATGIAAEALGWIRPTRLIAALQSGDVVVVDTPSGRILHRQRLALPLGSHANPHLAARTSRGLAILLNSRGGPPYVAFADTSGGVNGVRLDSLLRGLPPSPPVSRRIAGMAVDEARQRAFVVASGTTVADVDLKAMRVRYHELPESLALAVRCPPAEGDCSSVRSAVWLGNRKFAVSGADSVTAGGSLRAGNRITARPAGAAVLDTRSWTGWLVPGASGVVRVKDRLLMYGGALDNAKNPGIGLRAYRRDGRLLFHQFGSERVWAVELAGDHAYAKSDDAVRIVATGSGEVVRQLPPAEQPFYFLPSCTAR